MTSKAKTGPLRLSIPKTSTRPTKTQIPSSHNSTSHDFSDIPRTVPEDDYSQDTFALSPTSYGQRAFNDLGNWAFNDALMMSSDISSTSEATEESFDTRSIQAGDYDTQMITFSSCSPPLFPKPDGSLDQPLSDLTHIPGLSASQDNSPQLCFSNTQSYHNFSALSFAYDNDGMQHALNDTKPLGLSMTPQPIIKPEPFPQAPWDNMSNDFNSTPAGGLSGSQINRLPVTPPEQTQDLSANSVCPQAYTYAGQDGSPFDLSDTASLHGQTFTIGEPFCPLTPPLTDQDPNRTIRPQKQSHRPILSAAITCPSDKDMDFFVPHQLDEKPKDLIDGKAPRDHPFYSLPTQGDGKYHCPYATGENPCKHTATTQKCTYHKYLDSHLKPYRCKVPQCVDAHFSSNACLFRHEREAHGMHGHGENPHLCHFPSCDRSILGNGFPRRWNLHDHMRRVHDFNTSEKASSPEGSPVTPAKSSVNKKKDGNSAVRKRKNTISTTQTIKRARSTQSQPKAGVKTPSPAQTELQLRNAERKYYECLAQIKKDLGCINPQDPAVHERVNARLQELHTHALNYRCIKGTQPPRRTGPSS